MDSGCGSSWPVPAARRKASFQQTTWPSRRLRATRRANTGQGRAGQGRAGRTGQGRQAEQSSLYCLTAKKSLQSSYTGRLYPPSPSCRDARPGSSAGQGRAAQGRAGGQFASLEPQTAWGYTPRPPKSTDDPNGGGLGVLLYCPTAKKSFAGRRHDSPRVPGGFTLSHRSDGTLGRGPRSEPRAPMQMVSGALGSLGFRI